MTAGDDRLPPYPSNALVIVEVGSTAHGTGLDGVEDHDQAGVYVETVAQVIGSLDPRRNIMQRTAAKGERSSPSDVDRTWYSLRRWIHLAAKGNPSVLQQLWCPIEWLADDALWKHLFVRRDMFIGRHLAAPYLGYMQSQMERLTGERGGGHGKRGGGGREELIEAHGYDTKYAMHIIRLGLQCEQLLSTGELSIPMEPEQREECLGIRKGEKSLDYVTKRCDELKGSIQELEQNADLPPRPDSQAILAWSVRAHERVWGRS